MTEFNPIEFNTQDEVTTEAKAENTVPVACKSELPFCWPIILFLAFYSISFFSGIGVLISSFTNGDPNTLNYIINVVPDIILITLGVMYLIKRNKLLVLILLATIAVSYLYGASNQIAGIMINFQVGLNINLLVFFLILDVIFAVCAALIIFQYLTVAYNVKAFNGFNKIWFLPAILAYVVCVVYIIIVMPSFGNFDFGSLLNLMPSFFNYAIFATGILLLGLWIKKVAVKNQ